jgi:hypothetical protein
MSRHSIAGNVVTVFVYRRGKSRAECSCGFDGRTRRWRFLAIHDALLHAGDAGHDRRLCQPDWPLVRRGLVKHEPARGAALPVALLVAVSAFLGAALYFSAPAHADAVDSVYLDTLDHFGVPYVSEQTAIDGGYAVCSAFDDGLSLIRVVRIAVESGFTVDQASYLAGAAIGAYCPEYEHLVDAPASSAAISGGVGGRI